MSQRQRETETKTETEREKKTVESFLSGEKNGHVETLRIF